MFSSIDSFSFAWHFARRCSLPPLADSISISAFVFRHSLITFFATYYRVKGCFRCLYRASSSIFPAFHAFEAGHAVLMLLPDAFATSYGFRLRRLPADDGFSAIAFLML